MKTVFIAGHARLPSGMAAQNVYETITITAEVDTKYGVIVYASCTLATEHGRKFIHEILKGHSLLDGVDEVVKKLQMHYLGKASSALATAFRDLQKRFLLYRKEERQVNVNNN